jgi:hypothetical protein
MKPPFNVDEFKASFTGGQRAYCFWLTIAWPGFGNVLTRGVTEGLSNGIEGVADLKEAGMNALYGATAAAVDTLPFLLNTSDSNIVPFYVKTTTLPQSSLGEMKTHWMGAEYKFAGRNTFDDWSVSFYLDRDGIILRRFKQWLEMINDPQSNIISKPSSYMVDQMAFLLNESGETASVYKFYSAWPKSIGNVTFDYSDTGLATVDITFSFQYYKIFESEPGTFSETAKKFLRSGIQGIAGFGQE